jgi:hypothetical protein
MPTFYSSTGNPEVWAEKPDGYFTPEEWTAAHPPPDPEPEPPDERTPAEKRRDAYVAEADGFAWKANYYQTEANALREAGDNEAAAVAEEKAKELRAQYLAKKQEIRARYPDDEQEESE